ELLQLALPDVDHALDSLERVAVDDDVVEHGAVQAHLAQRRDVAFDLDAAMFGNGFLQVLAPFLARIFDVRGGGIHEQRRVLGLEEYGEVRAFAQVGVAAGNGEALDERRAEQPAEGGALKAQLALQAFAQMVLAALNGKGPAEGRAQIARLVEE